MTYTVLAIDPAASLIGAATASYSLAVGRSVIAIAPDAGAVASQAYTNCALRGRVIAAMREGQGPQAALKRIPEWDGDHAYRQVAAINRDGQTAAVTGGRCSAWAGSESAPNVVVVGNLLAGSVVLKEMLEAFEDAPDLGSDPVENFARRLLLTLFAGEGAGGDKRGRQSAAIQVARMAEETAWPPELAVDLRCDNSGDPLRELLEAIALQFG